MKLRILWILVLGFSFLQAGTLQAGTVVASLDERASDEGAPVPEESLGKSSGMPATNARIEVNIPARQMTLYYEGSPVLHFPIAVGSPTYKTPVGPRALSQIIWNPWWLPPNSAWAKNDKPTPPGPSNPLGPVKMELGGTIRMHGTNKDDSVGHPVSHGCMRMHNEDAKTLAWWIQSHFTDKTDIALRDTYKNKSSQSFYVKLPHPIPVEISYNLFGMNGDKIEFYPDYYGFGGNRMEKAIAWLGEHGMDEDHINDKALKKVLESARKETVAIKVSQIMHSGGDKPHIALGETE